MVVSQRQENEREVRQVGPSVRGLSLDLPRGCQTLQPTARERLKHAWSLAHRLRTEPTFSTSEIFWRRIETSCGCYDPRAQEGRAYFSIPHCTQLASRKPPPDRLTTGQGIITLTPDQIGCSVISSSTFKNRPRENTQHYQDAMACVVKYGKPSLFITVTCNPEGPEIKAALGPNDQACNRPPIGSHCTSV
ncbi:BZ3500_MvSof-1268-A1-R1_Chr11-3g03498 [Microbotryum saponariae]|uniref:BZ3500_MvSof-1268-A1-R1_Chr11-3g03498 protein n=1 Tax=Microbotryum saponariae TaxID=289078 RepID=A0A2X0MSI4_9BASI|nr:BZ3500_MvSof-1268-A1-R1_Chr11-3g03498 [Microbotryum saponariae]SDA03504.1 BZ3501_MvSof-1269-A2-R1_Chr11g03075 [Microbotryum saponariae]